MISVSSDEKVVMNLEKHWMYWIFPIITIVGIILIPYRLARFYVDKIVLTNKKFYVSAGLISKEVITTPIDKITNIYYETGLLGRIFGYGTIFVQSGAASGYAYIKKPEKVQHAIEDAMRELENEKNKKLASSLNAQN